MNFSFDNPLWWLMTAALVPLLVHLVARTRPKERRFSSVELLHVLVRRQARHARPKDWLLLLLRTLCCACLGAAFLLPYMGGGDEEEGGQALILVLDNTASMGAADGQQVRMNRALELAGAVVRSLESRTRVNMVTLAAYPNFLFEQPEAARPVLLRELARTQSQAAASADVEGALKAAYRQLNELPETVQGRLLIISDFQSSVMEKPMAQLAGDARVDCVSVAQTSSVENISVDSLSLTPARPLPGQKVSLRVALRHREGPSPREGHVAMSVSIEAGNLRLSQPCELSRGGRCEVQFELSAPTEPGDWLLTARTESDAYPGDNVRHLVVSVADKLDCLVIASDRAHAGFMLRALEHMPFLRTLCLPSVPDQAADFVVWHAPTADDVPLIQERLAAGETVLVVPDMVKDTALHPLLTGQKKILDGEVLTDGRAWQTLVAAQDDASFALFGSEALRSWEQEGVYSRVKDVPLTTGATVLMKYPDGVPALVRRAVGQGVLLVWNMPVTARHSRQGFSPLFLPMLAEQLRHARGASSDAELVAGQDYPELKLPVGVAPADVRLINQDGQELPIVIGAATVRGEQPVMPGVYRWYAGEELLATIAVNFPREESELSSFTPESTSSVLSVSEAAEQVITPTRVALWPWSLLAALIFFILELIISRPSGGARMSAES